MNRFKRIEGAKSKILGFCKRIVKGKVAWT